MEEVTLHEYNPESQSSRNRQHVSVKWYNLLLFIMYNICIIMIVYYYFVLKLLLKLQQYFLK